MPLAGKIAVSTERLPRFAGLDGGVTDGRPHAPEFGLRASRELVIVDPITVFALAPEGGLVERSTLARADAHDPWTPILVGRKRRRDAVLSPFASRARRPASAALMSARWLGALGRILGALAFVSGARSASATGRVALVIGNGGVRVDKRADDLATPIGDLAWLRGFYRADRVKLPATRLPMRALVPNDAWVDDVGDARYNRFVRMAYPAHIERLWRRDEIHEVLIVVGYNVFPTVAGAGSAIFLHIARKNFSPTVGCVAIDRQALPRLLPLLGPESRLRIEA